MPLAIRLFSFFLTPSIHLASSLSGPFYLCPLNYYNYSALAALEWPFKTRSNSTLLHSRSSSASHLLKVRPNVFGGHPLGLTHSILSAPSPDDISGLATLFLSLTGPAHTTFRLSSYGPFCCSALYQKYLILPVTSSKPLLQQLLPHFLPFPLWPLLPVAGIF